MSNKWTIENLKALVHKGDFSKDKKGQPAIVLEVVNCGVKVAMSCGNEKTVYIEDVNDYKFFNYDTFKEIEPPKEREYVVICEFWHEDTRVVNMLNEELTGLPFVKIPNGRRYKRYKDNGELEVVGE